jgi:transcription elongation factor GreA
MKIYVTRQGLQKMNEELIRLMTVESKNAIDMLSEARDKGDISENAEYESAKEYHDNLMSKISLLQEKIKLCEVITNNRDTSKVNMLSTVHIKNHNINKKIVWTLVPENEIDIKSGKISFNSPIGAALLGKKRGDIVEVNVPSGLMKLEILNISSEYE